MERKEFIKKLIINGSLAAVLPTLILQSCEPDQSMNNDGSSGSSGGGGLPATIDLNAPGNESLQSVGGYHQLSALKIIVINIGNNEFAALSTVCTHQGCTVGYNQSNSTLPCPCHGSVFSIDGSVLHGPANSPLKTYSTSLSDGILTIG